MFVVEHQAFQPLSRGAPGHSESLVIHARPERESRNLLVLVHGLNGARYATWGDMPAMLFDDCENFDIGLYDYASGTRRLRGISTALDRHADELADHVRDLDYDRIVLIGHSMGGLLCQGTIRSLIDSRTSSLDGALAIDRVAGLFLMATPQAGSLRVHKIMRPFSRDARVLSPHSQYVSQVQRRFSDVVQTNGGEPISPKKILVPTYALVATNDKWVDELSSQLGLPRDQIKTVRGSHTSLVKPRSRMDDGYQWMIPRLRAATTIGRRPGGSHVSSDGSGDKSPPPISIEGTADQLSKFLHDYTQRVSPGSIPFTTQMRITPPKQEDGGGETLD